MNIPIHPIDPWSGDDAAPVSWEAIVRQSWSLTTLVLAMSGWAETEGKGQRLRLNVAVSPDNGVNLQLEVTAAGIEPESPEAIRIMRAFSHRLQACERLRDLLAQIEHLEARRAAPELIAQAQAEAERLRAVVDPQGVLAAPVMPKAS